MSPKERICSVIKTILLIVTGITCWLIGIYCLLLAFLRNDLPLFLMALLPVLVGSMLLSTYISSYFGNIFGRFFYSDRDPEVSTEFSKARMLIANQQYEEALTELCERISHHPGIIEGKILLANLYYEKLRAADKALELAVEELQKDKLTTEHRRLVLLAVDILVEQSRSIEAIEWLHTAIQKIPNAEIQRELTVRASAIEQGS